MRTQGGYATILSRSPESEAQNTKSINKMFLKIVF